MKSKAALVLNRKETFDDGTIVQIVVYKLYKGSALVYKGSALEIGNVPNKILEATL